MSKLPTKRQKEFLDWELGVFFHFGLRTFNDMKDCDKLQQDINTFNPENLDCEQWIKTIKEAGAKYAVFTAKHHDGFALWPSKYTEYSVKNAPWKNGNGDVVREFVDACRKYDI
ncbi:MAG: alpha-L-fucosidase, partial [Clostridia bacterium]|nr:alpha-L-fucosidase [Clostridia bacterium]